MLTFRSRFRYFPFRFRFPFGHFRFPSGYSASASSFLPSGRSASQLALRPGSVPCVPFAFPLHPRLVSRPLPSGSAYSVLCSFPFVLPCFAPTAVPQVLPFWIPPPGSVPDFRFPFVRFHRSISLLSLSVLPFHALPVSASQLASSVLLFRSRFPDPSPYARPGFPCHLSGSVYLASCLFPFVLPSFAPTAVPLVLPFWITPRGSTLGFHILSSASALASHYSASVSSFPLFPFPPHSGFLGARPFLSSPSLSPSVPPVSMLPFRFRYSASLLFLSPLHCFALQALLPATGLLFPARPLPLAFALGSSYLACPF